jgi:hypothetical protein
MHSQLVVRVEAQLRMRDEWITAELEAARSNELLGQVVSMSGGLSPVASEGAGGFRRGLRAEVKWA